MNEDDIRQEAREGYWLCTDLNSDDCLFAKVVIRPAYSEPWSECTNAEKEAWEEEHNPPEPEENE